MRQRILSRIQCTGERNEMAGESRGPRERVRSAVRVVEKVTVTFGDCHLWGPRVLLAVVVLCGLSGCATWPKQWGNVPCCVEAKARVHKQPVWWHLLDVTTLGQLEQGLHLIRVGRKYLGVPVRSINLRDGEIRDSAFFTDRTIETLNPDAVRWGPTRPGDLPRPPYTITKLKGEGKTPGFFITDAREIRYLFKLDPADAPELLSGAEVVTSKLLHVLGYHVPSYEIVRVAPEQLAIGPDVTIREGRSAFRPLTQEDLSALLAGRIQKGALRVVSSKILEGEIMGPARFKQFRECGEMRALRVAYGWLNNTDAKDHNTLMVWDGQKTVGYLIDFGTSLGADAGRGGPKSPCAGWTNIVDLEVFSRELLTLGFYRSGCDRRELPINPRIGLFSKRWEPVKWKPYAPNLAFEEMTDEDADWMARRIARLSPAQIQAAVSAGQYSGGADADYLAETLQARREAVMRRYLHDEAREHR